LFAINRRGMKFGRPTPTPPPTEGNMWDGTGYAEGGIGCADGLVRDQSARNEVRTPHPYAPSHGGEYAGRDRLCGGGNIRRETGCAGGEYAERDRLRGRGICGGGIGCAEWRICGTGQVVLRIGYADGIGCAPPDSQFLKRVLNPKTIG
jgi:hypothetical protein